MINNIDRNSFEYASRIRKLILEDTSIKKD